MAIISKYSNYQHIIFYNNKTDQKLFFKLLIKGAVLCAVDNAK